MQLLKSSMKFNIYCIFLFFPHFLLAQEFNYWFNDVGSRSSMLAGAITAGVDNNRVIYWNPAGLASETYQLYLTAYINLNKALGGGWITE